MKKLESCTKRRGSSEPGEKQQSEEEEMPDAGGKSTQLQTEEETPEIRTVAYLRIHVERVVGTVCQKYRFLRGTVPINMILPCEDEEVAMLDEVVTVCRL